MKKILLPAISLLLCSCGTSQKTIRANTEATLQMIRSIRTEVREKENQTAQTVSQLSQGEEITTEILEYDTSGPIDSATGTPPVKRKEVSKKQKSTQLNQTELKERNIIRETAENTHVSRLQEVYAETEETSKRGMNDLQRMLCLTALVMIVVIVVRIIRRFKTMTGR